MLHSRTPIEYRNGTAAIAPIVVGVEGARADFSSGRRRLAVERGIDEVLADSFPASDPPSWTPGVARPQPVGDAAGDHAGLGETTAAGVGDFDGIAGVIAVSTPMSGGRPFFQTLVSLAAAAGIAVLVPFAILLVGLPIALLVRGLLEAIRLLFGAPLQ